MSNVKIMKGFIENQITLGRTLVLLDPKASADKTSKTTPAQKLCYNRKKR